MALRMVRIKSLCKKNRSKMNKIMKGKVPMKIQGMTLELMATRLTMSSSKLIRSSLIKPSLSLRILCQSLMISLKKMNSLMSKVLQREAYAVTKKTMAADELFPLVVWATVQADVFDVHACIKYMDLFASNVERMTEYGYALTTLHAAVAHINSLEQGDFNE